MKDAIERQLEALRARIRRLADEAAMFRATGRDAIADRCDNEHRQAEAEASALQRLLENAQ